MAQTEAQGLGTRSSYLLRGTGEGEGDGSDQVGGCVREGRETRFPKSALLLEPLEDWVVPTHIGSIILT